MSGAQDRREKGISYAWITATRRVSSVVGYAMIVIGALVCWATVLKAYAQRSYI